MEQLAVQNKFLAKELYLPLSMEVPHPEVHLELLKPSDALATQALVQQDPDHFKYLIPFAKGYGRFSIIPKAEHYFIDYAHKRNTMAMYKIKNNDPAIGYIGRAGLIGIDDERAEIIGFVAKQYARRGIMLAVGKTLMDYGFNERHLETIEAKIDRDNMASKALAINLGAVYSRLVRNYLNGEFNEMWEVRREQI